MLSGVVPGLCPQGNDARRYYDPVSLLWPPSPASMSTPQIPLVLHMFTASQYGVHERLRLSVIGPARPFKPRLPYFSSICLAPLIYSLPMVESSSLSSASIADMAASLHVNGTCLPPPPRRLFRHRSPCPDPDFSLKALGKALYKTTSRIILTVSSFATHMTQKRKLFSFGQVSPPRTSDCIRFSWHTIDDSTHSVAHPGLLGQSIRCAS